jgi:2-succinyl-6-hydroxy-2,4-cyclohexadiene-1-carboxylate synthase
VAQSLVLLHCFSGTHRAWDGVIAHIDGQRYTPLALDLPGHGAAASAGEPISFGACVQRVLARAPERFVLCGYSMGGRVALHVALAAPARVERLVLIGASPGIENPRERARRREADHQLADKLERAPFEDFIEGWRAQALFADEPRAVGELARADQHRNDPRALAAVLRGVGTGEMRPLWDRLAELTMPVVLLAGTRDHKYLGLSRRMVALLPDAELIEIEGGHGLVLECPDAVAAVLQGREPALRR